MNTLSTLKTLPLIALLAMGLALSPAISMADNDKRDRGHDRVSTRHDGGKGHHRDGGKSHRRDKGHFDRGHGYSKGHKSGHKRVHSYNKGHGHKHHGHTHKVYRPHRHGHGHADHVVVNNHYDHLSEYDRVRLMLGLHFDNIDIIYRDF